MNYREKHKAKRLRRDLSAIETDLMEGRYPSWPEMILYAAYLGQSFGRSRSRREYAVSPIIDGAAQFGLAWDDLSFEDQSFLVSVARKNVKESQKTGGTLR